MQATRVVLDALKLDAQYTHGDIGWEFWCNEGEALPQRTIDLMQNSDCAMFGAITSKPKEEAAEELAPNLRDKGFVYRSPIVRLRQLFDLYTNLRPCKAYPGNPLNYRNDIDLIVFRENTEGLYAGVEIHPVPDDVRRSLEASSAPMRAFKDVPSDDMAITARIITRKGAERIVRAAFQYAQKHGYKNVTLVEKPNVLRETSGLMTRVARKVALEFPGIELWETNIDAMVMWLVKNPQQYNVLVTSNLFGDVVSDLCAQLVGGLGFAASGNIGSKFAVFEPTHGSAPKYAGMYKVNPMATMIAAKLMLDWLGEADKSAKLEKAIATVIAEGKVRTYDMGGKNSTMEIADAVAAKI